MSATSGLRLTQKEIAAIKRIVAAHFGPDAEVRVFGSRTRPEVLGGDLVSTATVSPSRRHRVNAWSAKSKCARSASRH